MNEIKLCNGKLTVKAISAIEDFQFESKIPSHHTSTFVIFWAGKRTSKHYEGAKNFCHILGSPDMSPLLRSEKTPSKREVVKNSLMN